MEAGQQPGNYQKAAGLRAELEGPPLHPGMTFEGFSTFLLCRWLLLSGAHGLLFPLHPTPKSHSCLMMHLMVKLFGTTIDQTFPPPI